MKNGWFICNFIGDAYQYEVDPSTIGQYTGLNDKNGKEIYEGDIVNVVFYTDCRCKTLQQKAVIKFYNNAWCTSMSPFYPNAIGGWIRIIASDDEFEIIGNIHDNPVEV